MHCFQLFSQLGKIGQVIDVIFPEDLVSEKLQGHDVLFCLFCHVQLSRGQFQKVEYDTKLLLGSADVCFFRTLDEFPILLLRIKI